MSTYENVRVTASKMPTTSDRSGAKTTRPLDATAAPENLSPEESPTAEQRPLQMAVGAVPVHSAATPSRRAIRQQYELYLDRHPSAAGVRGLQLLLRTRRGRGISQISELCAEMTKAASIESNRIS